MFIRLRTRAQLLTIYKISTYLCPKDERESLKNLNTSPGIHKSLFTTTPAPSSTQAPKKP